MKAKQIKVLKMRQIVWTKYAQEEKINTLKYWTRRNHSPAYSKKINKESKRMLSLVKENPFIGEEVEDMRNVRHVLVLEVFSLFYYFDEGYVKILSFWDNRRDPENLVL